MLRVFVKWVQPIHTSFTPNLFIVLIPTLSKPLNNKFYFLHQFKRISEIIRIVNLGLNSFVFVSFLLKTLYLLFQSVNFCRKFSFVPKHAYNNVPINLSDTFFLPFFCRWKLLLSLFHKLISVFHIFFYISHFYKWDYIRKLHMQS